MRIHHLLSVLLVCRSQANVTESIRLPAVNVARIPLHQLLFTGKDIDPEYIRLPGLPKIRTNQDGDRVAGQQVYDCGAVAVVCIPATGS
jgi:hypothetical protein